MAYKQHIYFSQFWRVWDEGASVVGFWAADYPLLTCRKGLRSSLGSLTRALISFVKAPSCWPHRLLKASPPNTIGGLDFSISIFGEAGPKHSECNTKWRMFKKESVILLIQCSWLCQVHIWLGIGHWVQQYGRHWFLFIYLFWEDALHSMKDLLPWPGIEPTPLHWKGRVQPLDYQRSPNLNLHSINLFHSALYPASLALPASWHLLNLFPDSSVLHAHTRSIQSCLTLCDRIDCSLPGSSVPGISEARILEWLAVPSSWDSSLPRDQSFISCVSCIDTAVLYR